MNSSEITGGKLLYNGKVWYWQPSSKIHSWIRNSLQVDKQGFPLSAVLIKYIKVVTTLAFFCRHTHSLSLSLNVAWSELYNEIFITLRYFHIRFTLHSHWNLNLNARIGNLLVFTFKTHSGAYSLEWNSILWFMKIINKHKGTGFQHLELLGVTFPFGTGTD